MRHMESDEEFTERLERASFEGAWILGRFLINRRRRREGKPRLRAPLF